MMRCRGRRCNDDRQRCVRMIHRTQPFECGRAFRERTSTCFHHRAREAEARRHRKPLRDVAALIDPFIAALIQARLARHCADATAPDEDCRDITCPAMTNAKPEITTAAGTNSGTSPRWPNAIRKMMKPAIPNRSTTIPAMPMPLAAHRRSASTNPRLASPPEHFSETRATHA